MHDKHGRNLQYGSGRLFPAMKPLRQWLADVVLSRGQPALMAGVTAADSWQAVIWWNWGRCPRNSPRSGSCVVGRGWVLREGSGRCILTPKCSSFAVERWLRVYLILSRGVAA